MPELQRHFRGLTLDHDSTCITCGKELKAGAFAMWAPVGNIWCAHHDLPDVVYTKLEETEEEWDRRIDRSVARKLDKQDAARAVAEAARGRPETSGTVSESTSDKASNEPRNHEPTTPASTTSDPKYAEAF